MNYVISDIHGDLKSFLRMLQKIDFSKEDTLYIIGDILDRGPKSFELVDYIMSHENIVMIKGNHELFMQMHLSGDKEMAAKYKLYGCQDTLVQLEKVPPERRVEYLEYFKGLPLYETLEINGTKYVLTHSGYLMYDDERQKEQEKCTDITKLIDKWKEEDEYDYLISNDLHYIPGNIKIDCTLIVGHYPTFNLECDGIYYSESKNHPYVDVDNGLMMKEGRKLACLRLEDMKEFYA